jgi:uncharacterized caspase-like protein
MKVLQGDLANTGINDAVFIYFAGHGITRKTRQGYLGYLLPNDGSIKTNEMHKNISMQQIKADICPIIPAKHVLIIADACFGGLLLTRSAPVQPVYNISYIQEQAKEPVRQIITAGGKNERVLDGGKRGHSVFTGRLIEALSNVDKFITASLLGENLKLKVYGDAAGKGHSQMPLSGKIYGVGDFVFIPDKAKEEKKINDEIARLETEIYRYNQLKKSARVRKDTATMRELERNILFQEAELKRTKIRKEASERKKRLQLLEQEEIERQRQTQNHKKKLKEIRLANLQKKAMKLKKEVGSPASALGIDDTIVEIKEINRTIQKINDDFNMEIQDQSRPVEKFYKEKIEKLTQEKNKPKSKYESNTDYKNKQSKYSQQISALHSELWTKIHKIKNNLENEIKKQTQSLYEQRSIITKQTFPIDINNIDFSIHDYNAETQTFVVFIKITETSHQLSYISTLPFPKIHAREYANHPELLIPDINIKINKDGHIEPDKFFFYNVDKQKNQCSNIANIGNMIIRKIEREQHFISINNEVVIDTSNNLMWASIDNSNKINWANAKRYCENYRGGGFTDWRMPTIRELVSLYDKNYKRKCKHTKLINLSTCCPWAISTGDTSVGGHDFCGGGGWGLLTGSGRALPVRSGK